MTLTQLTPPADVVRRLGARARRDAGTRLAAGSALWLSLLLVTWWWVTGGGITDLGGWATGLESVGRITGLASAVLLLAQVVLMARVPVLERSFGQDELARIHRLVGFTSFNLMLAHLVTITWGYAGGSLTATPRTLWDLVVNYPGMLLATAATVCLVMVVVTSIRAARRTLRYESWHLMHLYAYLGVGLAIPHQLWTGADLTSSTGRQVFWWGAWIAAAGSVLVWRVGLPLWRNLRHDLRVAAVVPEGDGTVSVHVTGRHLHRLPVEAGQFFTWRFGGRPGRSRGNPYSLSAAPDGRSLRITVQDVGDGSAATAGLTVGSRAWIEGPYGRLEPARPQPHQGADDRRRGRHHPAAGPRGGTGVRPGRGAAALPLVGHAALRRRARPPSSSSAASSSGAPRRVGAAPTPGSATASPRPPTSPPSRPGCRTSPSATSTSAAPARGPTWCSETCGPRACRRPTSTSRPSAGDLMKRIVLWMLSTLSTLVVLFGYHTSDVVGDRRRPARGPSRPRSPARPPPARRAAVRLRRPTPPPTARRRQRGDDDRRRRRPDPLRPGAGPARRSSGTTITHVSVLQYPDQDGRDLQISNFSLPQLVQDTLDSQGDAVAMVSGATVHQRGLPPVAAERPRPGRVVTAVAVPTTRRVEQVMGMPISLALRGRHAAGAAAEQAWQDALTELRWVGRGVQHLAARQPGLAAGAGRGHPRRVPRERGRGAPAR